MVRIAKAVASKKRRDRIKKRAKGFWGDRKSHVGLTKSAIMKADAYNYVHRKHKKRDMRSLWSCRIGVATRVFGISYSRFIYGLTKSGCIINRKMLASIALDDINTFNKIVDISKSFINAEVSNEVSN